LSGGGFALSQWQWICSPVFFADWMQDWQSFELAAAALLANLASETTRGLAQPVNGPDFES
jgi:hypothetical protein